MTGDQQGERRKDDQRLSLYATLGVVFASLRFGFLIIYPPRDFASFAVRLFASLASPATLAVRLFFSLASSASSAVKL